MTRHHSAAWADFWAENAKNNGAGCLPDQWNDIVTTQQAVWREFSKQLPRGARVLDLATGDGRVMDWLIHARRDVRPVGTDLSPRLPTPPKGTKMRGGIAMEDLPFRDNSYDAVTSQFGFEYGDTGKITAEIARVLAPGGIVGLMTHRADGPILAHNRARKLQIDWVIEEKKLFELAKRSLALRNSGIAAIPPAIAGAPSEGAARFGEGSAAWEISEAIRQTLVLSRGDNPANASELIEQILRKARNEIGRIRSLEAACATTDDDRRIQADIVEAGLMQVSIEPVTDRSGTTPFADFRIIRHAN